MNERLQVIQNVQLIFANQRNHQHFSKDEWKKIAGLAGVVDEVDYGLFGSMGVSRLFRTAINDESDQLEAALDRIPASGDVIPVRCIWNTLSSTRRHTHMPVNKVLRQLAFWQ